MEWLGPTSTVIGAIVGVGAALLGQHVASARTDRREALKDLTELYAGYLAALVRTYESLRVAAADSAPARRERVQHSFQDGGAYEWRFRMTIQASIPVRDVAEAAFHDLRALRDLVMNKQWDSPECKEARIAFNEITDLLQKQMREALAND